MKSMAGATYSGIGGALVLVPVWLIVCILMAGGWAEYASGNYSAAIAVFAVLHLLLCAAVLYLFFKRYAEFRALFIAREAYMVLFNTLLAAAAGSSGPYFLYFMLGSIAWIVYAMISPRVRNTFSEAAYGRKAHGSRSYKRPGGYANKNKPHNGRGV